MTSTTERVDVTSARAGVARWLSQNVVVVVSTVLAVVSCLVVTPDAAYRHYFDVRTLVTLFCMLAVVKAMQEVHVFGVVAARLVAAFGTRRAVVVGPRPDLEQSQGHRTGIAGAGVAIPARGSGEQGRRRRRDVV